MSIIGIKLPLYLNKILFLLMKYIAESEKFKIFTVSNKALLFLAKLNKPAGQSLPQTFLVFVNAITKIELLQFQKRFSLHSSHCYSDPFNYSLL